MPVLKFARDVLFWSLPHSLRWEAVRLFQPSVLAKWAEVRSQHLSRYDQLGCIFVHIPKTAGTSIGSALFGRAPHWHFSVRTAQLMYTRAEYAASFKFAFVRNPWERTVSAYDFLRAGGLSPSDVEWRDRNLRGDEDLPGFVERWLTKANAQTNLAFIPQVEFLRRFPWSDMEVDYIGRFERIEDDFAEVCRRLGVRADLPHENRSRPSRSAGDYRSRYTDSAVRRVAHVYGADIEAFGYEFEGD